MRWGKKFSFANISNLIALSSHIVLVLSSSTSFNTHIKNHPGAKPCFITPYVLTFKRKITPQSIQNGPLYSQQKQLKIHALYAGGFGSSTKKTRKKKKKKSWTELDLKTESKLAPTQQTPKLDRFGLPIQTAENIFPPLPADTELIPVYDSSGIVTKEHIDDALTEYLQLNHSFLTRYGDNVEYPMQLKLLHKSPPVLSIDNFFTPEECEEYIKVTAPADSNAPQNLEIQSATFSSLAQSKRTSTTWFCHYNQVPTLLTKVKNLFSGLSSAPSLDIRQMEEPQVVRYRIGEEFSWHYDEIPSSQLQKEGSGGQRIATVLVYLNSIEDNRGGGTVFRDLIEPGKKYKNGSPGVDENDRLTMQPKKGSALIFFPGKSNGTPDDRTLHKGEIMKARSGKSNDGYGEEKMIAQIWVHEHEYLPQVPPGNSHESALDPVKQKEIELYLR